MDEVQAGSDTTYEGLKRHTRAQISFTRVTSSDTTYEGLKLYFLCWRRHSASGSDTTYEGLKHTPAAREYES